jgi:hypothetical protein
MQDTLNIQVARHPMWDAPTHGNRHFDVLRKQIARSLTPFDGRTDSEHVIHYCRGVYQATDLNVPVVVLVGQTTILRVMTIAKIEAILERATHLPEQARVGLRQQIRVVHRMSDEFATALAKSATTNK